MFPLHEPPVVLMKLFDFAQDCVAIAAVIVLVQFLSEGSDVSGGSPIATTPSDDAVAMAAPSAASSVEAAAARGGRVHDDLDRLESELSNLLHAPLPFGDDQPAPAASHAFGVLEAGDDSRRLPLAKATRDGSTPVGSLPIDSFGLTPDTPSEGRPLEGSMLLTPHEPMATLQRVVPPLIDPGDYDLSGPGARLRPTAPQPAPAPMPANATRRRGGSAPSASRPLHKVEMLPPPPADETDETLQPFGASLGGPLGDTAHGPQAPRRIR